MVFDCMYVYNLTLHVYSYLTQPWRKLWHFITRTPHGAVNGLRCRIRLGNLSNTLGSSKLRVGRPKLLLGLWDLIYFGLTLLPSMFSFVSLAFFLFFFVSLHSCCSHVQAFGTNLCTCSTFSLPILNGTSSHCSAIIVKIFRSCVLLN